jgi:hypothetical protein
MTFTEHFDNVPSRRVLRERNRVVANARVPPRNAPTSQVVHRSLVLKTFEDSLRTLFEHWADQWLDDTQWNSSISSITRHPHFSRIVELGRPAAKFILERMARGDVHVHWFPALKDIAHGFDPVPAYERGHVPEMTRRWLAWGASEGLIGGNA